MKRLLQKEMRKIRIQLKLHTTTEAEKIILRKKLQVLKEKNKQICDETP